MSLSIQFHLLIHTILYGVFLGLCLDTFNLFLQKMAKKIYREMLIILYWTAQLPLAVLYFHRVNSGEFQSFLLIFVLLGGGLYYKLLQKKYIKELKMFLNVCRQLYRWLKKLLNVLIFTPLAFIFGRIFDIMVLPKKFFRKKRFDDDEERLETDGEISGYSK